VDEIIRWVWAGKVDRVGGKRGGEGAGGLDSPVSSFNREPDIT
jgi:hypothetical protein